LIFVLAIQEFTVGATLWKKRVLISCWMKKGISIR
jgi:hypothetical protein